MEGQRNNDNFLVGIRCYTYNQSKYITDALSGFAMQETTFPYIAMVVDDASTDGEQDVIAAYVEEHFDTNNQEIAYKDETDYAYITFARHKTNKNCYIVVLYLKENHYQKKIGSKKLQYLSQWRDTTKYEAVCEGDDYWIDPLKLQKQVDFLEVNPEYGMCYTSVKVYNQIQGKFLRLFGGPHVTFRDIFNQNCIPTPTVVMRYNLHKLYECEINPSKHHWRLGDLPMWLWFAYKSKIGFINSPTTIYRELPESACHSSNVERLIAFSKSYHDIRIFYNELYQLGYSKQYFERSLLYRQLYLYAINGCKKEFLKAYKKYIRLNYKNLFELKPYYYMLLLVKSIIKTK